MSLLARRLKSMSGPDLVAELAYTDKEGRHKDSGYLDCVRWEIQRRDKKRQKRSK